MEQIAKPVLVLVENEADSGALSPASGKALRLGRSLTTGPVAALTLQGAPDQVGLKEAGADVIFDLNFDGYSPRIPGAIADVAAAAVGSLGEIGAVVLVGDSMGRAVAGMLAATLDTGGIVDVTGVEVEGGELVGEKSALGGSWTTRFTTGDLPPVLALRPGAGTDVEVPSGAAQLVTLSGDLSAATRAVHLDSSTAEPKGARISLTEADVVVVGGRGVNGNFDMVGELADALGGAVGATRVACDEGWVERSAQIGQTGFTVAPKVYLGIGVSGAVHHTCGMLGSETIVAVVDDPDAPILEIADFAVIGDAAEVIPQALEALGADA